MSLRPQLCLLAFRALLENKRDPKSGKNLDFEKLLEYPISSKFDLDIDVLTFDLSKWDQSDFK